MFLLEDPQEAQDMECNNMDKCSLHYKGQEYWAMALCDKCEAYLKENGNFKAKESS